MSKNYLSYREVRIKIEGVTETLSTTNKKFVTKSDLLTYGKCNQTPLEKYNNNDFVIDDDITSGDLLKQLQMTLHLDGYTLDDIRSINIVLTSTDDSDVSIDLTYNS